MNTNPWRKLWRITRFGLLAALSVVTLWLAFHHIASFYEKRSYTPIGQLVEVDGRKMHVYMEGDGEQTIVLLSGLGTAAPSLDYQPLIRELAQNPNYKIAVVESFGYGWSDLTNEERSVDRIVEEIRTALKQAGVAGPYVLMPHSVSGIYSMYYANQYPEEVRAVIGIDPTLPQAPAYFGEAVPKMPTYMSYVASLGLTRLALAIMPDELLPVSTAGTYSEQNLRMMKALTSWRGFNRNIVEEANAMDANIAATANLTFPSELPILIFTVKVNREPTDGKTNITFYETQLPKNPHSGIVVLEAGHYPHWTRSKEMAEDVNRFLEELMEDR